MTARKASNHFNRTAQSLQELQLLLLRATMDAAAQHGQFVRVLRQVLGHSERWALERVDCCMIDDN